jgi:hypothetical protein
VQHIIIKVMSDERRANEGDLDGLGSQACEDETVCFAANSGMNSRSSGGPQTNGSCSRGAACEDEAESE